MVDEKAKSQTETTGPGDTTAPAQPEQPKQPEQKTVPAAETQPSVKPEATEQKEQQADTPAEPKAASVSVYNFGEIMADKKAAMDKTTEAPAKAAKTAPEQKAPVKDQQAGGKAAPKQEAATPPQRKEGGQEWEKPQETTEPPKHRGRPPKDEKDKAAAPAKKDAPAKTEKAAQKAAEPKKVENAEKAAPTKKEKTAQKTAEPKKAGKAEKAAPAEKADKAAKAPKAETPAKGAPEVKAPAATETAPTAPAEAPRPAKDEQIVYLKLSDLHAFKNHPFQVRNDEEMRAMVSSVKDKGITQPAIVRPREDGGYEIVSGHRRQMASELAGFTDMPCIIRDLTDERAITQMVEDNTAQRENILPSERAKALKMQLEAIKHQGAKDFTSGQLDPKDAGRRSNEVVAERNKMTVKQVQRFIKLNDLVPDLQKMMDEGQIKFTPAVELSYIKPKNQRYIAVTIEGQQSAPSLSQAQRMRELDQKGVLNGDVIDGIMMEDKKEVDKVILTGAELGKYFGKETTPREMKDQIVKLLDEWKGQQKEQAKPEKKAPVAEK